MNRTDGLYIHVPFCRSKCPYCSFYSSLSKNADLQSFTDAVTDEIKTGRRTEEFTRGRRIMADTVYFGGGTPCILSAKQISDILLAAKSSYDISPDAEITVECNPSLADKEYFLSLARSGVNRISIGLQSAADRERRLLGRTADRNTVEKCIKDAKNAGIENISLDVMLGIPCQTPESLDETIDFCISSDVKHISAYMLSIEEGTHFYKKKDALALPDEDTVCDMYMQLSGRLTCSGFEHYEISNFAKKGYQSRHNTKYWLGNDYLGIGPSAHSLIDGKRFFFESDTNGFTDGNKAVYDCEGGTREEYIMLRLRLSQGIDFEDYKKTFREDFPEEKINIAKQFEKDDCMLVSDKSIRLTVKGFLISNYIISRFI